MIYRTSRTAVRPRPEDEYNARKLVLQLESNIRATWRGLQEERRAARKSSDPWFQQHHRHTAMIFACTLYTLLSIRHEARIR